jgi:KDO2-lipid IV(A) lauroyltransferase
VRGLVVADEIRQTVPDAAPEATRSPIRRWAADFWLNYMFWHVRHVPFLARATKGFYLWFAVRHSHVLRRSTAANARRIFGPATTDAECLAFTRRVVANFVDFVCDVGVSLQLDRKGMLARIESVEGKARYDAARAAKNGAIIATAHMGSFEAGAAALLDLEPRMHVVFKRDQRGRFEQVRAELRQKLGVIEAPIDEGWTVWMRLRDALANDEVVMVQADRVMPGQKGTPVPFLHGHLLMPTGPLKLAMATGSPIVPVITTRTKRGKIRIHVEEAVYVRSAADVPGALAAIAKVLEKYVRTYPEQWLLLQPAFFEDTHPEYFADTSANRGDSPARDNPSPRPSLAREEGVQPAANSIAATPRGEGAALHSEGVS